MRMLKGQWSLQNGVLICIHIHIYVFKCVYEFLVLDQAPAMGTGK